MKISVRTEPIETLSADWLVAGVFEGAESPLPQGKLGELLAGPLEALRSGGDFEGKSDELLPLYQGAGGVAAKRMLLVGLGKPEELSRRTLHRAARTSARFISKKPRSSVLLSLLGEGVGEIPLEIRTCELVSGAFVGVMGRDLFRQEKKHHPIEELQLVCEPADVDTVNRGVLRGKILGEAVNLTRELVNTPAAEIYPESFCGRASQLSEEYGFSIEVLGPEELVAEGMQCILGVGGGSKRTPRLLILRYERNSSGDSRKLCFVGKGITFDSGGLSLKTAEGMSTMKCDMAGAATVLAATTAIARLGIPVNLTTIAPLAENLPSGSAIKPGDVLTAKNGKTIEVLNTDAEGRLVLADALAHAVDLGATHIVDLATLTGSCMVALGMEVAGVMTNEQAWGDEVLAAADRAGELAWPLPMFAEYDELIKSEVADIKNVAGRWGGAITAAKLLAEFVGQVPWTHVDIAGPSFAEKDSSHQDGGATGYFALSLVELAEGFVRVRTS